MRPGWTWALARTGALALAVGLWPMASLRAQAPTPADPPPGGAPIAGDVSNELLGHDPSDVLELEKAIRAQQEQQDQQRQNCGPCRNFVSPSEEDWTLGMERVPVALFEMESAHTVGKRDVFRLRIDGAFGWNHTDRLEYFQARSQADSGIGPVARERSVDYQDIKFTMIRSGPKFQAGTEMTLRSIDPEINPDTVGLADMTVHTKTVLSEGSGYKAAHYFLITIPTGYRGRGMGTGHVSMENALLYTQKIDAKTYFHLNAGYWFSIAANPLVEGQMWHYGLGLSRVLYDHPVADRALMGTLEFTGWTIVDGGETDFDTGAIAQLDPESIFNFHPGLRVLLNDKTEVGLGLGFAISEVHWFEEMFRLEYRQMF